MQDNVIAMYRELADGLSDMVEGGRLTEAAIPIDYRWLVDKLAHIAEADPEGGCVKQHEWYQGALGHWYCRNCWAHQSEAPQ